MPLADLPARGEESAPSFLNDQPEELVRYFSDLHLLLVRYNVANQQDRKQAACKYTSIRTEQLWKTTNAWLDQAQTFEDFKAEVLKLYPGALGDRTHTLQELEWTVERYARIGIQSVKELGEYYRHFLLITRYLIAKGSLSTQEQSRGFFRGLSPMLEVRTRVRLQQKFLDHFPDDPYPLSDILEAANFALMGTTSTPSAPHPPLPLHPPATIATPDPFSIQPDPLDTVIAGLAKKIEQTLQDQLIPAAIRTSAPGSSLCRFCGSAGHFVRTCEVAEDFIHAGKCKRNSDGKIVLPTGAMAPRGTPDSLLRDRIENWHQQNPGHMAAQLFCKIAATSPKTHAAHQRQHFPSHCFLSPRSTCPQLNHHRTRNPDISSKAVLRAQQKDPPLHLIQRTATTKKSADRQAHQEPSHTDTPAIALAHTATEDMQGPQVTDMVTEQVLQAPIAITQEELRALAPEAWAQAVSTAEHECEEPPALMMLGKVLGNQYKPATTPRSARLAQIANEYATAALAIPSNTHTLHHPFLPHITQPEPTLQESCLSALTRITPDPSPASQLEPRPSALASITLNKRSPLEAPVNKDHKYEHIPRSLVGTETFSSHSTSSKREGDPHKSKPSALESAVNEPEAATQPAATDAEGEPAVAPPPTQTTQTIVHTAAETITRPLPTVSPSITAKAAPSVSITAGAPTSPTAAARPQSAQSPFPFLPWRVPAVPFSALRTSYHRAPNTHLRHFLPQPPQHRPPFKPPPADTTEPECSHPSTTSDAKATSPSPATAVLVPGTLAPHHISNAPDPPAIPTADDSENPWAQAEPFTSDPESIPEPTVPCPPRASALERLDELLGSWSLLPTLALVMPAHALEDGTVDGPDNPEPEDPASSATSTEHDDASAEYGSSGSSKEDGKESGRSSSRSDEEGEHNALSWEETPSMARTPTNSSLLNSEPSYYTKQTILSSLEPFPSSFPQSSSFFIPVYAFDVYSFLPPHTRISTNPTLRTAIFFSWEENWGTAQPSKCRIRTLTTSPSEQHPSAANSPQAHPAIRTHPQPFSLIIPSSPQLVPTFPQNAAPVRGLSNFGSTRPIPGQFSLPSSKTRRGVLNHPRVGLATDPLNYWSSPSFAFSTAPHVSAGFKTRLRRVPHLNRSPCHATSCAEACTTARAQTFHLPSQTSEQVTATFLQNAAPIRGLSNSSPTHPRCGPPVLPSSATCGSVHDYSRAWPRLHPLGARIDLVQVSPKQQHKSACLETLLQRLPYKDHPLYQVTSRAEPCATARAQDVHFSSQSEEPPIPTLPQNAAPVRGLSDLAATHLKPPQPRIPSYAACKDVRGYSCFQLPVLPLREEDIQFNSFLGALHLRAEFTTRLRRAPYSDRHPYQIARRAEACTTACTHNFYLTFSSREPLMPTFLQHAALVRGLRISTPTYPKFGPIVLSSFVACESVHDCSRAWIALYTLGARINIVKVSLGVPHSRAVLAILLQHALGPDGDQYEVLQRAEACTVARAQDCYCIPQQVEHLSPTHLQNAALARGLSAFVTTRLRPRQLRLPSYAAREDMHDCSHAQIVLHLLRVEASTFSQFLSMPHATARLATRPRSGPRPHNRVYKISQRAEACTTARTPIIFPIPFPARQHVPTFPQSAASARAFSNFASPLPQPRKPLLRSYAARRDVHGRLWPLPAPQYLMEKNSSFRLLRALHAAADLATRHQRGPRLDRRLYRISGCAEACLTASVQVWSLIPLSPEQLIASFPQSATRVRTVSDSVSQYSRPGKSRLQNYAARGAVLDHSYPRLSPLLLRVETSSVQASQRMPQSSAALVTRCRRAQDPNERPYQVARRAEVCTVTRALSWPLLPLSSEKFTQTFPQITALVCGPSNSVSTLLRLEYPPTVSYTARRSVPDRSHSRSAPHPIGEENTSSQSCPIVPHQRAALAFRTRQFPGLDGSFVQVSQRAVVCLTVRVDDSFPISQSVERLIQPFLQSAAPTRGLSPLDLTRRQHWRTPLWILALRGDVRGYSRITTPSYQRQVLRLRIAFLVRRSSLRLERTEDSPDLSWEEMMRRRCGSMRGNAQSDDLEPRARRSGAPARQAGGVATCVPQPQPHTLNTHTNLPSIARPRHLIRSPSNLARIPSICGTMHPQRIRAQRRPDPPQSHQNCLGQFQGSQVPPSCPCHVGGCPMSRVVSQGPGEGTQ